MKKYRYNIQVDNDEKNVIMRLVNDERSRKIKSGNTAEVDFIYEDEGEIVPVEVKAADNTQAKSYKQFCKKYHSKKGLKLSRKNIAENLCESTVTYNIPLYLEWNIDRYIK